MPIEWIIPAVVLLLAAWGLVVRRRLLALQEEASHAWSEIDALFRQRQALISALLETIGTRLDPGDRAVKGLASARRAATRAQSPAAIGKAELALNAAIEKAIAEAAGKGGMAGDPDLRRLRADFQALEEHINAAREAFNEAVGDFNAVRGGFPGGLFNHVLGFSALERLPVPTAVDPQTHRRLIPV